MKSMIEKNTKSEVEDPDMVQAVAKEDQCLDVQFFLRQLFVEFCDP